MNAEVRPAKAWLGRGVVALVIAGLCVAGYGRFDRPALQAVPPTQSGPAHPRPEQLRIVAIENPNVVAMGRVAAVPAPVPARQFPPPDVSRGAESPVPQFRFLGKVTQGDETLVMLHDGGATLVVRGTGLLNDDYVVDALTDAYVVLHQVTSGESQIIELAARAPAPAATVLAGESAQD